MEAPWQNGMAERGGGTFKARLLCVCREHAVADEQTLKMAISAAAVEAGNADINESGFSPNQWVLGRQPRMPGDVLGASRAGGVNVRLAEQSAAADPKSNFAVRLAMLETSRVAQMRLRFSRRFRRALLARGRVVPPARTLAAGDLAFFYRKQMKMRKDDPKKGKKTKLVLNKWHGPGMVLGHEGNNAIYIANRGGMT